MTCINTPGCTQFTLASFNSGYASTLNTVGALVSALVIAELAVTKAGDAPVARALDTTATSSTASTVLKAVTAAYLLVWLGLGLTAFVAGALWYPDSLKPLTDFGQAWLGVAIAAVYAYFGIARPDAA